MADYLFDGEETIATLVCGVDEAGRGPLAGPVVAAAVILNPDHPIEGLRDSKKLTAHAREVLAEQIKTTSPYVNRIIKKRDGVVNKTFVQMLEALGYDVELTYVKREG